MEEGSIGAGTDFVDNVGLEIGVDGAGNIFALAFDRVRNQVERFRDRRGRLLTSLGEESAEALIRFGGLAFFGQVSIRL